MTGAVKVRLTVALASTAGALGASSQTRCHEVGEGFTILLGRIPPRHGATRANLAPARILRSWSP
jgi:hypothetical protein